MILVKEMPTSGQFVAVWEYVGVLYSNSYMWEDDCLVEYNEDQDQWLSIYGNDHFKGAVFIVKGNLPKQRSSFHGGFSRTERRFHSMYNLYEREDNGQQ